MYCGTAQNSAANITALSKTLTPLWNTHSKWCGLDSWFWSTVICVRRMTGQDLEVSITSFLHVWQLQLCGIGIPHASRYNGMWMNQSRGGDTGILVMFTWPTRKIGWRRDLCWDWTGFSRIATKGQMMPVFTLVPISDTVAPCSFQWHYPLSVAQTRMADRKERMWKIWETNCLEVPSYQKQWGLRVLRFQDSDKVSTGIKIFNITFQDSSKNTLLKGIK